MKQVTLKLKSYAGNVSILDNDAVQKRVLRVMLIALTTLVFLYVLFLGNMVKNIIERKSLELQARALSSEVGNLELTYLSMSNSVDLNLSYSLGFKDVKAIFATRKALGLLPASNTQVAKNDL